MLLGKSSGRGSIPQRRTNLSTGVTIMIDHFCGHNAFLSNFYMCEVTYSGIQFPSSENAYQFAKLDVDCITDELIDYFQKCTAGQAKRAGQKVSMRESWHDIKIQIMEQILRTKFENDYLRFKLLETGTQTLAEGNTWGDTFWGICDDRGSNHLGKLLMKLRKDFMQVSIDDLIYT
jgi:ribA/ribD-fused uncharacterized protein